MGFDPDAIDGRDPAWIRAIAGFGRLLTRYHRAEVRGLEHIPDGPALYVGNHSAGLATPDTWIVLAAAWERYGIEALPYGLGHDLVMRSELLGPVLQRLGGVRAAPENAARLFAAGRKVLVYPGGDVDSMRPFRDRDRVRFGGRRGFMRLALRERVPIVPIVSAGSQESFIVFDDLPGLARAIGAGRWARMKVWPLTFSLPWGLTLGPVPPFLPLPTRILCELLPPLSFAPDGPEAAADEDYVRQRAEEVEGVLQAALTRLAAERRSRLRGGIW